MSRHDRLLHLAGCHGVLRHHGLRSIEAYRAAPPDQLRQLHHYQGTIRRLLREYLPSGFPQEAGPLTVGDVACRMVAEHQRGAELIANRDLAISRALVVSPTVIPEGERLKGRRVKELLADAGLDMADAYLGARYWIIFMRSLTVMLMSRAGGRPVVIACERQD